jgi:hypothetical protein
MGLHAVTFAKFGVPARSFMKMAAFRPDDANIIIRQLAKTVKTGAVVTVKFFCFAAAKNAIEFPQKRDLYFLSQSFVKLDRLVIQLQGVFDGGCPFMNERAKYADSLH